MAVRIYMDSSKFAVSRAGFDAKSASTAEQNLHISSGFRHGQFLSHETVTLTNNSGYRASVSIDYGGVPDVVFFPILNDGVLRVPSVVYGNNAKRFFPHGRNGATVSSTKIDFAITGFGATADGDVLPEPYAAMYMIFRKGSTS